MLNPNDNVMIIQRKDYEFTLTHKYFLFNDTMIKFAERFVEGTVMEVTEDGNTVSVHFEFNGDKFRYVFHATDLVVTKTALTKAIEEGKFGKQKESTFSAGDYVVVKKCKNYENTETNRLYSFEPEMIELAKNEIVGEVKNVSFENGATRVSVYFKGSPWDIAWDFDPSDLEHAYGSNKVGDMTKEELKEFILNTIREELNKL
ncbi:MAG: hypothetical protein ACOCQD_03655 [archaeon]